MFMVSQKVFFRIIFIFFLLCNYIFAIERVYVFTTEKDKKCYYNKFEFFGDISDIIVSISSDTLTNKGLPSVKIEYSPKKKDLRWVCLYFVPPVQKLGYDITGVEKITFFAKGEKGKEVITSLGIGGLKKGVISDTDIFQTGTIKLTKEWQKYSFGIIGDLSYIVGGFFIILELKDNPTGAVIYLGDIYYEGKKIEMLQQK